MNTRQGMGGFVQIQFKCSSVELCESYFMSVLNQGNSWKNESLEELEEGKTELFVESCKNMTNIIFWGIHRGGDDVKNWRIIFLLSSWNMQKKIFIEKKQKNIFPSLIFLNYLDIEDVMWWDWCTSYGKHHFVIQAYKLNC